MGFSLPKTVVSFLKSRPEEKFTARQIAEWIFESYPAECQAKKAKSSSIKTDTDLIQQFVAEIGSQRPTVQKHVPQIKITEERPRKYYYTNQTDEAEVESVEADNTSTSKDKEEQQPKLTEYSLYPKLSEYLWSEFHIYSKRIDEKRSANKQGHNGNKWLFPDIVGMEDLSADWHPEIRDCVNQYSDKKTKMWSFEVKILINRSNVRQTFFQAVSNSSWANFGYLVAAQIEADTLSELRILSAQHGIGVIKLDAENPAESQILIPAKEQVDVDWNAANRLANENKDFLKVIKLVRQFYQTGDPRKADWDIPEMGD